MRLCLTPLHTEAEEQAKRAWTTGCRTLAELGRESKFLRASGIAIVVRDDMYNSYMNDGAVI
jgi:hypothetical protein